MRLFEKARQIGFSGIGVSQKGFHTTSGSFMWTLIQTQGLAKSSEPPHLPTTPGPIATQESWAGI